MDARKSAKRLAFAGFLHPLWEFGARKYITDHHTPYTIHGFGDSLLVGKIHDWLLQDMQKFRPTCDYFPFKRQAIIMVRPDENKPLKNAFTRI